jgi:hypothetical protein
VLLDAGHRDIVAAAQAVDGGFYLPESFDAARN